MCRQAGGGGCDGAGGVLGSRHAGCQEGAGRLVTLGGDLEGGDGDGGDGGGGSGCDGKADRDDDDANSVDNDNDDYDFDDNIDEYGNFDDTIYGNL